MKAAASGTRRPTLERHAAGLTGRHGLPADLAALLESVAAAGQTLAEEIRHAALAGVLGYAGERNSTGDAQKKLDLIGNEAMLTALAGTGLVAAVVSEELEEARPLAVGGRGYIVCTDPLDGSSNSDINGALGTIFGVWRRAGRGAIDAEDLLRRGSEQVLAGYVMYGPSMVLVYTAGQGVYGFTLDPDSREWVLTHERIRCPIRGPYYSANVARFEEWQPGVRRFLASLTRPDAGTPAGARIWSQRYTGALVADLHRSLLEGGIYFYPADRAHPHGKLRLLYECAPLAFVVEQAGGAASTGAERVLDVRPGHIHQRVPLAIGSVADVALYERFFREGVRDE